MSQRQCVTNEKRKHVLGVDNGTLFRGSQRLAMPS